MANRNRTAGNGEEREIVKRLKSIWSHAITTRKGSRERDAQKIDIMNADEWSNGRIPIDIQVKNAEGKLDIVGILKDMKSVNPSDRYKRFVIFHKMTKKTGSKKLDNIKFMPIGRYAYCELHSLIIWLRLIKRWYNKAKQFDTVKKNNLALKEEIDELRAQLSRLIES